MSKHMFKTLHLHRYTPELDDAEAELPADPCRDDVLEALAGLFYGLETDAGSRIYLCSEIGEVLEETERLPADDEERDAPLRAFVDTVLRVARSRS